MLSLEKLELTLDIMRLVHQIKGTKVELVEMRNTSILMMLEVN